MASCHTHRLHILVGIAYKKEKAWVWHLSGGASTDIRTVLETLITARQTLDTVAQNLNTILLLGCPYHVLIV